jgi:hypothetical protein
LSDSVAYFSRKYDEENVCSNQVTTFVDIAAFLDHWLAAQPRLPLPLLRPYWVSNPRISVLMQLMAGLPQVVQYIAQWCRETNGHKA